MIRVLIVDDHAFVRAQIAELLSGSAGIEVVGECTDGAEVVRAAADTRPDVVVMDIRMPVMSGIDATRALQSAAPRVRVLIVTGSPTPGAVQDIAQAGAAGLLLKGGDPELLVEAVRQIAAGGTAWSLAPAPSGTPTVDGPVTAT